VRRGGLHIVVASTGRAPDLGYNAAVLTSLLLGTTLLFASLLVAARLYPRSRAERGLAAMVLWIAVVHGVVHLLGWTETLTPARVAAGVLLSSALMAGASLARPPSASGPSGREELARRAFAVLALPWAALAETFRARSASFLALLWTYAILAWSALLVVLAPSGSWDGLWYHEPMVGFALQEHGFGVLELPVHLEWVNGYPRLSENLMLLLSAFGDRTLIDGVPHVMAVAILLAFFVIARRFSPVRTDALGFACVLMTVPAVVLQLRSTYVDLSVLATFLAALHFATRPGFSARDAWLAAIAIGLVGQTKSSALLYVAVIGLFGLFSVARAVRSSGPRILRHALPAFLLSLALFVPTYARNWQLHANPIWPLRYHSELLRVDFAAPHDIQNMQLPLPAVLSEMYAVPVPGQDYADTRRHAFGYGLTFLGLPLLVVAFFHFARRWLEQRREGAEPPGRLLALFFAGLLTFVSSPAFYWARYALPFPALSLVLIVAWLGHRPRGISGEGPMLAMFLVNAITLAWAEPRWDVPVERAIDLVSVTAEERVYGDTSPLLFSDHARRWREEHLGPGDVAAFDDDTAFIGNVWTDGFANRVEYVPFHGRDEYLGALDALNVVWVVVRRGSTEDHALSGDPRWRFQEMCINDSQLYVRATFDPE
jgi:hypothetical protein